MNGMGMHLNRELHPFVLNLFLQGGRGTMSGVEGRDEKNRWRGVGVETKNKRLGA